MMLKIDASDFRATCQGFLEYAEGFLTTLKDNETQAANAVADAFTEAAYEYVDANARMYPSRLHHVYEWGGVGVPTQRLFTFEMQRVGNVISVIPQFLPSRVPVSPGHVFVNKAAVMESGQSVVIAPTRAKTLHFWVDGEEIFTNKPVTVPNPGGAGVQGSFDQTLSNFKTYFEQSFLSGASYKARMANMRKYFKPGKRSNRGLGQQAAKQFLAGLNDI
mgnify:CR=1 FL=1